MTAPQPFRSHDAATFVTSDQALTDAVTRYWQRRFPGKPGRVIAVDRTKGGYPAANRTAQQLKPPPPSVTRKAA